MTELTTYWPLLLTGLIASVGVWLVFFLLAIGSMPYGAPGWILVGWFLSLLVAAVCWIGLVLILTRLFWRWLLFS